MKHSADIDIIRSGAALYGITLDTRSCDRIVQYTELILQGSLQTNLVSKRDLDRFATYHILDSLKISSCFSIPADGRLLDFGTGAGLPGIPLAISYPDLKTILVDSRKKRCIFLETVIRELDLKNASVLCTRIETLDQSHNNSYDLVSTRGTVNLVSFYSLAGRLLSPGGSLVSIKGDSILDECTELEASYDHDLFNILYTHPVHVDGVRDGTVVVMTKNEVINKSDTK